MKEADIFLHGFATTPAIWPDGGPELFFDNLEREADRLGKGLRPKAKGQRPEAKGQRPKEEGLRLIGWSMGGMVAMLVAARFPEAVSRLVLVSTTPKFVASDDFPAGLPLVLLRRLEKRIKIEGITAFHRLVFPGGQQTGLADLSIDRALQELAALEKVDLRPLLPLIKAPTVIIHGDRDEICLPAAAEYLQKNIRGSELVLLPAVGHAPLAELERYVR